MKEFLFSIYIEGVIVFCLCNIHIVRYGWGRTIAMQILVLAWPAVILNYISAWLNKLGEK